MLNGKYQSIKGHNCLFTDRFGCSFVFVVIFWLASCALSAEELELKNNMEEPRMMDELVVTGSQIPLLESQSGRFISTIGREDIERLPAHSVTELLDLVGGLDVRQRGANGVQTDISIRGSSFEQVVILVDGINMSDPQTGHHNMDLAVTLDNIERIEILKGPGARIYGQNAMAGVINIITRSEDKPLVNGRLFYGSYDYYHLQESMGGGIGALSNRLSVSRTATEGHMKEAPTDAQKNTFSYNGRIYTDHHTVQIGAGVTDKDFGAYKFYSDTYPDQKEKTQTLLTYLKDEWSMPNMDIMSHLFWRRHEDAFNIKIGSNWFLNEHSGASSGFQMHSRFSNRLGTTAIGGEIGFEDLSSSNLGTHDRSRKGLFVEHKITFGQRWGIGFGTSAIHYTDWGWQHWPGGNINVKVLNGLHLFSSVEKSFRIPTYTELFYDTPANRGNPNLEPEKAWTYEIGVRHHIKGLRTQASLFLRDAENIIDWTRTTPTDPWQVRNMAEIKNQGYEIEMDIFPKRIAETFHPILLNLSYTYIDADKTTGAFESKYALDHLKHQAKAYLTIDWLKSLSQSLVLRYEKRLNRDAFFVMDTRLIKDLYDIKWFLDICNVFDQEYVSSGFAKDPGRWIYFGLSFETHLFK